ncbi:MAG: CHAP domain-containing protein [bacterium]|nr:CHAP domain-containing protein [bacterium]
MKQVRSLSVSFNRRLTLLVSIAVFSFGSFAGVRYVSAQSLQEQINNLTRKNSQTQDQVEDLKLEAASYEDAINTLQARINAYQREIDVREAQSKKLQAQIIQKQKELEKQKMLLGKNIKAMYLEGDITTLEMLATSKSLTEYFDKQQYRSVVKDKIKDTLDKVTVLKAELQTKKVEVEKIIKQQEQLRTATAVQKTEQARLLNFNESQQSQFNSQMKSNQKKINELKRQQAIENARLFGGNGGQLGGGGYPWGYARCIHTGQLEGWCYNYDWGVNGNAYNWNTGGYGYRNCTDWVAYRVRVAGGRVPSGLGNARQWDDRGPSYGLTVSSTPRVGAAAVSNNGYYGHVMYVEAVNGDGTIVVSDYNRAGTGKYDMNVLSTSTASYLRYVYF